jgi:predicted AlkP superfamily pyrophosphatase or phosphodiesterase
MNKLVIFLYIDALNSSIITHKNTPFLLNLTKKYFYKKLENVPGYSFAIQSCLLSGKYPEETNLWMPYYYDPKRSPLLFKMLKKAGDSLPLKKILPINYLLLHATRKFFLKKGVHANNIPFGIIDRIAIYPYYYMSEIPFFGKLKRLMIEKNETILTYLGPPKIRSNFYHSLLEHLDTAKYEKQVVMVYDDALDGLGHRFGPNSDQYISYVRSLDRVLMVLYKKLRIISGDQFTFIVFTDHGQCERKHTLDIISELDKKALEFGHDYISFVDATIALFWVKNEHIKEKLLDILRETQMGVILNEQLKKKYHILFNDRRYGEIIFVLKPGNIFYPNFFSPFSAMKGLHGYLPETDVQKAHILSNKEFSPRVTHIKNIKDLLLDVSS